MVPRADKFYAKLRLPEEESYFDAAQKIYYMGVVSLFLFPEINSCLLFNHCVYKKNKVIF